MIRLTVNTLYSTRNGTAVRILNKVSNGVIGHMIPVPIKGGGIEKVLVPSTYYRAQFRDTGEVVFYGENGNIISEKPGADDSKYALNKEIK